MLQRRLSKKAVGVFGLFEIGVDGHCHPEKRSIAFDILIGDDSYLRFKWAAVQHLVEHYQAYLPAARQWPPPLAGNCNLRR